MSFLPNLTGAVHITFGFLVFWILQGWGVADELLAPDTPDSRQPGRFGFNKARVIVQQTGFDVGAQLHAVIQVALHETGRVGKLLAVPVEHITFGPDRRVAG